MKKLIAEQVKREKAHMTRQAASFMKTFDRTMKNGSEDHSGVLIPLVMEITRDVVDNFDAYNSSKSRADYKAVLDLLGPEMVGNVVGYQLVNAAAKKMVRYQLVRETAELFGDVALELTLKAHDSKEVKEMAKKRLNAKYSEKSLKAALADLAEKTGVDVEDEGVMNQMAQNMLFTAMDRSGKFAEGEALSEKEHMMTTVEFNEEALEELGVTAAEASYEAANYLPLVCRPRDWTSVLDGGYYTEDFEMPLVNARGSRQEKAAYFAMLDADTRFDRFRDAVNEAQHTAFRVNKKVYRLAKAAFLTGEKMLDIPSYMNVEIDEEKLNAADKKEQAMMFVAAKKENLAREGKRRSCESIIETARKFKGKNEIYFVYQADFRGRLYNVCPTLNTQGSDLAKGLLTFAKGKALGTNGYDWLCIHAANTYGGDEALDKCSFVDRIAFVNDNAELIKTVANGSVSDPEFLEIMEKAENPFMFYAVCQELAELVGKTDEEKARYVSYIPVGMDGSCNGQQWAAGFLRSRDLATNVNLVASTIEDKPADLYRAVADGMVYFLSRKIAKIMKDVKAEEKKIKKAAVQELADAYVNAEKAIQRKICKRATMTEAYAVTPGGQRDMLWDDAPKSFMESLSMDAKAIYKTVYGVALAFGLAGACMASRDSMDFFKSCARSMGKAPIQITNPMGFTMRQAYKKEKNVMMYSVLASKKIKVQYKIRSNEINASKQESAIAPNITHSHDSAHMLMVVERMKERDMSWLLVHDDYATHACEVSEMNKVIRETFVEIHKSNILESVREQLDAQGADTSKIGIERDKAWKSDVLHNDFNLDEVLESTYFFA